MEVNEESLKEKKIEAEKGLKEVLSKAIDLEAQISDLRLSESHLVEKITELEDQH